MELDSQRRRRRNECALWLLLDLEVKPELVIRGRMSLFAVMPLDARLFGNRACVVWRLLSWVGKKGPGAVVCTPIMRYGPKLTADDLLEKSRP